MWPDHDLDKRQVGVHHGVEHLQEDVAPVGQAVPGDREEPVTVAVGVPSTEPRALLGRLLVGHCAELLKEQE